ncbi:MAG: hypothetical protein U9N76_00400, partial [Candidatus Marinimicrobia bacterium]|nr:hypothetical protein [Candidatus Neomarinimicrobiota bacterium]
PLVGFLIGMFVSYFMNIQIGNIPIELIHFIFGLFGVGIGGIFGRMYANELSKNPEDYFEIVLAKSHFDSA